MSQRFFAFLSVALALCAAFALASSSHATPGHPRVCGHLPLDSLPHGLRFELTQELATSLDLEASEPREVFAPEELRKTEAACVFVRSPQAPWRWHRNTRWSLVSVRHASGTRGGTTYSIDLANRDHQTVSLRCRTTDGGRTLTAEAFDKLFGEHLHPAFVLDDGSCG
jgi:hypothetical protein